MAVIQRTCGKGRNMPGHKDWLMVGTTGNRHNEQDAPSPSDSVIFYQWPQFFYILKVIEENRR